MIKFISDMAAVLMMFIMVSCATDIVDTDEPVNPEENIEQPADASEADDNQGDDETQVEPSDGDEGSGEEHIGEINGSYCKITLEEAEKLGLLTMNMWNDEFKAPILSDSDKALDMRGIPVGREVLLSLLSPAVIENGNTYDHSLRMNFDMGYIYVIWDTLHWVYYPVTLTSPYLKVVSAEPCELRFVKLAEAPAGTEHEVNVFRISDGLAPEVFGAGVHVKVLL